MLIASARANGPGTPPVLLCRRKTRPGRTSTMRCYSDIGVYPADHPSPDYSQKSEECAIAEVYHASASQKSSGGPMLITLGIATGRRPSPARFRKLRTRRG